MNVVQDEKSGLPRSHPGTALVYPTAGFVVKTYRSGTQHKVFINVCSHPDVELPLTNSGERVTFEMLRDTFQTVENLRIPIAVGESRSTTDHKHQSCSVMDVLVCDAIIAYDTWLQAKCTKMDGSCASRALGEYRKHLIHFVLRWVEKETEWFLEGTTTPNRCSVLANVRYKRSSCAVPGTPEGNRERWETEQFVPFPQAEVLMQCSSSHAPAQGDTSSEGSTKPSARPLIQELPPNREASHTQIPPRNGDPHALETSPLIARGFLNNPKKQGLLYPEGTTPEGVLPPNAGDPLGHIPASIRQRSKIIDCTTNQMICPPASAPSSVDVNKTTTSQAAGTWKNEMELLMKELEVGSGAPDTYRLQQLEAYESKRRPWPYILDLIKQEATPSKEELTYLRVRIEIPQNVEETTIREILNDTLTIESNRIDFGSEHFHIPLTPYCVAVDTGSARYLKKKRWIEITALLESRNES